MSRRSLAALTQARLVVAQSSADLGRMVASGLAIAIGAAFVVVAMSLTASSDRAVLDAVGAQYASAAAVVTPGDQDDPGAALRAAQAVAQDDGSATVLERGGQVDISPVGSVDGLGRTLGVITLTPAGPLRWEQLVSGRFPERAGEVAVSGPTGLALGDTVEASELRLGNIDPDEQEPLAGSPLTVVGTLDIGSDPRRGVGALLYVTEPQAAALGVPAGQLRVAAAPGESADATAAELRNELGGASATAGLTVRSGEEVARAVSRTYTGSTAGVTAGLLVFVVIALAVAALVIANTFTVVLAQRVRELALLRCVGATTRQVARSMIAEAAIVGLAASVLGAALGAGLTAGASLALRRASTAIPLGAVVIPVHALLLAVLAGTATCVLASLVPARAATRVRPLEALRPADPAATSSRQGSVQLVVAVVTGAAAVVVMVAAANARLLPLAVAGGVVSIVSVVALVQRYAATMAGALGSLVSRRGGVASTIAAQGARRHPRRTAACALVLLIGIALTSAVLVGGASTRATADQSLGASYPVDVSVQAGPTGFPDGLDAELTTLPEVVDAAAVTVPAPDAAPLEINGIQVDANGLDPSAATRVVRATDRLRLPQAGQAVMPFQVADQLGVTDGSRIDVTGPRGQVTLDVVLGGTGGGPVISLARSDLDGLTPTTTVEAWLRLADGLDDDATEQTVADIARTASDASYGSQVRADIAARQGLNGILDSLLVVVTALLAVSVLIALLGLGNTLALSAVERRRESAVLRALGMTRAQLGATVVWEAVLISTLAAGLGCVLGAGYGLIGVRAALGGLDVAIPWAQLAVLTAGAVLAGVLASVVPALRTARGAVMSSIAVDR